MKHVLIAFLGLVVAVGCGKKEPTQQEKENEAYNANLDKERKEYRIRLARAFEKLGGSYYMGIDNAHGKAILRFDILEDGKVDVYISKVLRTYLNRNNLAVEADPNDLTKEDFALVWNGSWGPEIRAKNNNFYSISFPDAPEVRSRNANPFPGTYFPPPLLKKCYFSAAISYPKWLMMTSNNFSELIFIQTNRTEATKRVKGIDKPAGYFVYFKRFAVKDFNRVFEKDSEGHIRTGTMYNYTVPLNWWSKNFKTYPGSGVATK